MPFPELMIFGNSLTRWMIALLTVATVLGSVALWRWIVSHRVRPMAMLTDTFLDDVAVVLAEATSSVIVVLLAIFAGTLVLKLPDAARQPLGSAAVILFLVQVGLWGRALIERWTRRYQERNIATNAAGAGTARLMAVLAQMLLYSLVVLLILDNLPGIEVTALVASLGIGGVAVALATQNILADLFASLSIALDKPFVLGDFIVVGDEMGTVEEIGLKTTRVRSLSGEQLIFSNADLLGSRIRNFARLQERRVLFTFVVRQDTAPEALRALPEAVRQIIEGQEQVRFDRAHLRAFSDSGLVFEVVYFVLTPDFNRAMDIQHAINLGLLEHLAATGVRLALPAQLVYSGDTAPLSAHLAEATGGDGANPEVGRANGA